MHTGQACEKITEKGYWFTRSVIQIQSKPDEFGKEDSRMRCIAAQAIPYCPKGRHF
jgi:hypothetical protein